MRIVVVRESVCDERTSTLVLIDQQAREVLQIIDLGGGGSPLMEVVHIRKIPIVESLFRDGGFVRVGRCSAAKYDPCTCDDAKVREAGLHKISFKK